MAIKKEISMDIDKTFDYVLEEGNNTSINLRKIAWGNHDYKLDIRKWYYKDGEEIPMKGVTMTDEGANELANVLVSNGFGDTRTMYNCIRSRKDFNDIIQEEDNIDDDEYYDPKELLGGQYDEI